MLFGTALLTLAGCSGTAAPPAIHAATDTDMTLHYGDTDYLCHICYVNKNNASLTLSSPDTLSGLTFHRTNGRYSLSLGSLLCKGGNLFPNSGVPAKDVLSAFDDLSDSSLTCTGQTEDGTYTFTLPSSDSFSLTTDSSGSPLAITTDTFTLTYHPTTPPT